jgi:hypothetical protein
MSGTTATQKLTYPTSGDILKQQAQYIETLAKQVDARSGSTADAAAAQLDRPFAVLDATIQRTNPTSVTAAPARAAFVVFDSVVIDTAALVDLTADSTVISLTSPGTWLVGAYVDYVGIPGGSSCTSVGSLTLNLRAQNANPSTFHAYVKDLNTGHSMMCCSGLTRFTNSTTIAKVFISTDNQGTGCGTSVNVFKARMWAFKVREV